jgi:iron complex outermembrane receptor protein
VRIYAGNPQLKPEESDSYSFGMVLRPRFGTAFDRGGLTLTVDRWHIAQTGVVGVFDYQNAITLDYLMRLRGSTNPNVVRAPVTADDVALAAGTGLAPVGQLLTVNGVYQNLLPRTVEGIDVSLAYRIAATPVGDFRIDFNYARLTSFFQKPSSNEETLLNAQAAGVLSKAIAITGAANLIGQGANPADKWTLNATWKRGPAEIGLSAQYTGPVYDVGVTDPAGDTWVIQPLMTASLYGQWTFGRLERSRTTLRVGVRNIADAAPPLSSGGYLASVYSPMPRYLYVALSKRF